MNRAELVKTLELVKPALATNAVVPIFQCFNFCNHTVSAYDDQVAIVGPAETDEHFGIHGNTLLGLLSNSKAENAELELKDNTAIIKLGKTISKLPYQDEDSFIFRTPAVTWVSGMPFTDSLAEAITMCLETVSNDSTQAALLGITFDKDKMYSCNGDALTRIQLKKKIYERALMPTAFCTAVLRLWAALEVTTGTLHFCDEWVHAKFGDWSVYGRVLEISKPIDFEKLIKNNLKTQTPTQPLPAEFSEALSRARVLADPESQKTTITIAKGKLQMLTDTHMGEVKDDLIMKGHPDIQANVNASYLQRAIQYCDQIAFLDSCTLLEKSPDVLQIISNMA